MQPWLEHNELPFPFRDRYWIGTSSEISNPTNNHHTRLPCDDMKVADSITCVDFETNCADANDKILFAVQGAGDQFVIDMSCKDFLAQGNENWSDLEY